MALMLVLGVLCRQYVSILMLTGGFFVIASLLFLFYHRRSKKHLFHVLLLVVFGSLGFLRMHQEEVRFAVMKANLPTKEQEIQIQGRIYKKEIKNDKIMYYLNHVILFGEQQEISCKHAILYPTSDTYTIGTIIKAKGTFIPLRQARNEGNYDEQKYFRSIGIDMKILDSKILQFQTGTILGAIAEKLYQTRGKIQKVYEKYLPMEESGVLSVIALGEKSNLDDKAKKLYQLCGLSHILAISGMHISVVGMSIYHFFRKRGKQYLLSAMVAWILVLFYALMSGMSISAIRAVAMFGLVMLGTVWGEAYDSLTALALIGGTMLLYQPQIILSVGFLFSYGAVIGVMTVAHPIHQRYDKYCRKRKQKYIQTKEKIPMTVILFEKVVDALLMGVAIQLATLPMVAYFYYEIPLYVLFLNLLLLPLLGILLGCGLLGGVLGVILSQYVLWENIIGMILLPCHWILYLYEMLADISLKLPYARVIVGQPKVGWIIVYYFVLYAVVHLIKKQLKISYAVIGSSILVSIVAWPKTHSFEIDVLDVGQGDGIYLSTGDGVQYFMDGGSSDVSGVGEYRILPFLKKRGVRSIDYWMVSHCDADHVSGLIEVLESGYEIGTIVFSNKVIDCDNYQKLLQQASESKTAVIYIEKGDSLVTETSEFACVYPGEDFSVEETNAASLVMVYARRDFVGVFTGDTDSTQEFCMVEKEVLKPWLKGAREQVDFLKVAHHGSKNSSAIEFLEYCHPKLATISAGEGNRYGHPSQETVERMNQVQTQLYDTITGGQIIIRQVKGQMEVRYFMEK